MQLHRQVLALLPLALAALASPAAAQYPAKPITVVVPFAAGGPTDVVARLVGERMSRTLGQQLVIENVAGAGGTTGMSRVAAATPNGYLIGIGNNGIFSAAPAFYPDLKYDPLASFEQIGIISYTPQAIVAKNATAATNLSEFIVHLEANHEKLSYGHAGIGSTSHVAGLVFNGRLGLKPAQVPYRGTGPALTDLISGQLDYIIDQSLNVIPQVKAGTIKIYGVASKMRLESLPDVPTTAEGGTDFLYSATNVMVAPKGTPAEVTARLLDALGLALDEPAMQARFVEMGSMVPAPAERGAAPFRRMIEDELTSILPMLKAVGITGN